MALALALLCTARATASEALTLTLDDAVLTASVNNLEVQASGHDALAFAARTNAATASRWPTLGFTGSYFHWLDDQRLNPARFNNDPALYTDDIVAGDLVLNLPLFTGGRLWKTVDAARMQQDGSNLRQKRLLKETTYAVTELFYRILAQESLVMSLDSASLALEQRQDQTNALVAAQKVGSVESLRIAVRVSDLKQRSLREQAILRDQKRAFLNLLGTDHPVAALHLVGVLDSSVVASERQLGLDMPAVLACRTDYQAASKDAQAQEYRTQATRSQYWPSLGFQASYGMRGSTGDANRSPGARSLDDAGKVGIIASMPIFDGGQTSAKAREESEKTFSVQKRLKKLELQIRRELESAQSNIETLRARFRLTQNSIQQAEQGFAIEMEKYRVQRGTLLDVFDAQNVLLQSQATYTQTLAEIQIAKAQLRLVTGECQ